jgi:hypothetical protein
LVARWIEVWYGAAGNRQDGHDGDLGGGGGGERLRGAVGFEAEVEGAEGGDTEGKAALLNGDEHASADAGVMVGYVGEHEAKQRPEHQGLPHSGDG